MFRPSCIAWDGETTRVLLEGHPDDVAAEAKAAGLETEGSAPAWPDGTHRGRISVRPSRLREVGPALDEIDGVRWLAEVGVGTVHVAADDPRRARRRPRGRRRARGMAAARGGRAGLERVRPGTAEPRDPRADPGRIRSHRQALARPAPGRGRTGAVARVMSPAGGGVLDLDEDELVACVACGLCLPHCPTYRVTGLETASPRGRIAAMQAVDLHGAPLDATFERYMEECVQCRGCEAACPSSVPFGHLMEGARAALDEHRRPTRPWARRARRVARLPPRPPAPLASRSRSSWLLALAQRVRLVPARLRCRGSRCAPSPDRSEHARPPRAPTRSCSLVA